MTGSTLGAVSDAWSYNTFGEPVSYAATAAGTPLFAQQYTRDNGGRITQKTETIFNEQHIESYRYDTAGRLTSVTRDGVVIIDQWPGHTAIQRLLPPGRPSPSNDANGYSVITVPPGTKSSKCGCGSH